jgi:hypothetical protein
MTHLIGNEENSSSHGRFQRKRGNPPANVLKQSRNHVSWLPLYSIGIFVVFRYEDIMYSTYNRSEYAFVHIVCIYLSCIHRYQCIDIIICICTYHAGICMHLYISCRHLYASVHIMYIIFVHWFLCMYRNRYVGMYLYASVSRYLLKVRIGICVYLYASVSRDVFVCVGI